MILTTLSRKKGRNPPKKNAIITHFNIITYFCNLSRVFLKFVGYFFTIFHRSPKSLAKTAFSNEKNKKHRQCSRTTDAYNINVAIYQTVIEFLLTFSRQINGYFQSKPKNNAIMKKRNKSEKPLVIAPYQRIERKCYVSKIRINT